MSVDEAAGALRTLAAGIRIPQGRVGRDGVAILTPLEIRGLSFHTVVFTGLAEGGFPARGRPDPILGDAERRRIAASTGVRLPLAEERSAEADVLFAFACEAARDRLVLIAPRGEATSGRPRLPSRMLLQLASAGPDGFVGVDDFLEGNGLEGVWQKVSGPPRFDKPNVLWVDSRERDTQALIHLSEHGTRPAAKTLLSAILTEPDRARRRLEAWNAARSREPGEWDGLLGGRAVDALRDLPASRRPFAEALSPTRLERYIACPFAYFLHDVLGVAAPEEPGDSLEIEPLEFGKLAHEILHRTYRRVIDERLSRDDTLAALGEAWTTCCAQAEARGLTGAQLSWDVRKPMLLDDLRETVRRDPVFEGDGRPAQVEWVFGEEAQSPVGLDVAGRQIRFKGRIDRFDETAAGARVIDYKTGSCRSEDARVKAKLSVQLPVYQLAVRQMGGGEFAEIACEYLSVTRRGGFEPVRLTDAEDSVVQRLAELVTAAVDLAAEGVFPRTTAGTCDYCEVRYACGMSSWRRERKRGHDKLARVVGLQSRLPKEAADGA